MDKSGADLNRILRSARLISWAYRLTSTAVGFITIRWIIGDIGAEGYGHMAVVIALATTIGSIDLGFGQALPRYVARHQRGEDADPGAFWAACLITALAILLLQFATFAAAVPVIGRLQGEWPVSNAFMILVGALLIVGNTATLSSSVLAGFQLYIMAGIAKILRSLMFLGAIGLLVHWSALSVASGLWSTAGALVASNAIVTVYAAYHLRHHMPMCWAGFPVRHMRVQGEIAEYSLRGWLFSLSTTLLTALSVTVAGAIVPASQVAMLQVSLAILVGVTAFATGAMVPLTTIVAQWAKDGVAEVSDRIVAATRNLVYETMVFAAALLVFFFHYGERVVALIVGHKHGDPVLVPATYWNLLFLVSPVLATLPYFPFRFGLVSAKDNSQYSTHVFIGSVMVLAVGSVAAWIIESVTPLAAAAGLGLAYRSLVAFAMAHRLLPEASFWSIAKAMLILVALFEGLALVLNELRWDNMPGGLPFDYASAAFFIGLSFFIYIARGKFEKLLKF